MAWMRGHRGWGRGGGGESKGRQIGQLKGFLLVAEGTVDPVPVGSRRGVWAAAADGGMGVAGGRVEARVGLGTSQRVSRVFI